MNPNPARFDHKKAEAINGDHIRLLDADGLPRPACMPYLTDRVIRPSHAADGGTSAPERRRRLLVQERMQLLGEARWRCSGSCSSADDDLVVEDDALAHR